MTELIAFGILSFTTFFTIINPLGVMPIFMTMTSELDQASRKATAKKAIIASFVTIILFAFTGQILFKFFGISVNSFRVVGGIIFFLMGMDMLQARLGKVKVQEAEIKTYVNDISITPLAIPMICGPGAITNAIVMMEDAQSVEMQAVLIGAIVLVMGITLAILLSAGKIIKILGQTGNNVLMRLMGLIIMVIAIEFFLSGFKPIFQDIIAGR
ncbi:MarC family protein [Psychroflexus montanilacus]|uniref:MarC family protein n=1 Tax=Psychroflexus montanilacus TaxID=2873598 RepID=UPI001CCC0FE4|nr:NAAT family transporter [Psychroflexus montanilacus]MBZ9653010.1 MarC family protein [Psychroflexus montanilacus]